MGLTTADSIAQSFTFTTQMIENFATGISDEAALVTPPFPANSLNWVIGHIITGRQQALRALGGADILTPTQFDRYTTGSAPVTATSTDAVPLSELMRLLQDSRDALTAALSPTTDEQLETVIETRFGPRPVRQHLEGLHWHETYHVGQLEILRQVALQAKLPSAPDQEGRVSTDS